MALDNSQDPPPGLDRREALHMDRWHRNSGAKRGAPEGNTNRMTHGIYADRFLSEEEKIVYDGIIAQLYQDFEFNKSSDFIQVEMVAVCILKLGRAVEAGDVDAVEKYDRMIRAHLKDLKATKIVREADVPQHFETTPAEWATALLEKVAESKKQGTKKVARKRKRENQDG